MRSSKPVRQKRSLKFRVECLVVTSAIAASAGIGFGTAIRTSRPIEAGSSLLHRDQAFPPRQDWPIGNETQSDRVF